MLVWFGWLGFSVGLCWLVLGFFNDSWVVYYGFISEDVEKLGQTLAEWPKESSCPVMFFERFLIVKTHHCV